LPNGGGHRFWTWIRQPRSRAGPLPSSLSNRPSHLPRLLPRPLTGSCRFRHQGTSVSFGKADIHCGGSSILCAIPPTTLDEPVTNHPPPTPSTTSPPSSTSGSTGISGVSGPGVGPLFAPGFPKYLPANFEGVLYRADTGYTRQTCRTRYWTVKLPLILSTQHNHATRYSQQQGLSP
jgi:hypothetical protein